MTTNVERIHKIHVKLHGCSRCEHFFVQCKISCFLRELLKCIFENSLNNKSSYFYVAPFLVIKAYVYVYCVSTLLCPMFHSEQEFIVDLKLGRNAGQHKVGMGRIDSILDILKYTMRRYPPLPHYRFVENRK